MKQVLFRLILAVALVFGATSFTWGQQQQEQKPKAAAKTAAQATSETAAQAGNSAADVRAGTKISAELVSTIDTRTAKPGDHVVARVTKDVRQGGQTVVRKGDRLIGKVQSVEAQAAAEAGSRLAVTFDRLAHGETTAELNAVLTTIVSTPRRAPMPEPEPAPSMGRPAPAPSRGGSSSGGGLVGGVTSTVGSTVGGATSAVGSTAGGVTGTVDATSSTAVGATSGTALATPIRTIRIDSQASAQNNTSSSSMLSTKNGHLRLESGTQMQFRVAAQSEPPAKKQ